MSHQDHLHQETKVLPLRPHSTLLTKQFLAANHRHGHPGTKHLGLPVAKRSHLKPTLLIHEPEVTPMFQNLPPDDSDYKKVLKSLHTKSVKATIQSYIPSSVKLPPARNKPVRVQLKPKRKVQTCPTPLRIQPNPSILLQHNRQFCPRQMPTLQPDPPQYSTSI